MTGTGTGDPGRRRRSVVLALAVVLQIVLLTIYYHPEPKGLAGDEVNYIESSAALQRGERLDEPMRAPLYPYCLAALGAGSEQRAPTQAVQIALFLVTALCFGAIARQLFTSQSAADLTVGVLLTYYGIRNERREEAPANPQPPLEPTPVG